jgi:uroporphyrinogen-III synthase
LIRRNGGEPFVAPSMRELPIEENESAFAFAERLIAGGFDMVILMTGVGTRYLARVVETRYPLDRFKDAMGRVTLVARGPKPVAALREMGLQPSLVAPEPNTWHEVLQVTEGRPERRIAVQEYGRPSAELEEGLRARGAEVTAVPVYQWALPEDVGPLEEAVRRLAAGAVDVALFTTSQQVVHLMEVAERLGSAADVQRGLERTAIGSIGPTTSEALREHGIEPVFEASHPKLGFLVKEAADRG